MTQYRNTGNMTAPKDSPKSAWILEKVEEAEPQTKKDNNATNGTAGNGTTNH